MSDALDFLHAIWGDGYHSLNAGRGGGFRTIGVFATPEELAAKAATLEGENVWFGVHGMAKPPEKRGENADVTSVVALKADLDWHDPERHADADLPHRQAVLDRMGQLGTELAPQIVVETGGGLQAYWRLQHDVGADDGAALQAGLDARLAELGLDNERGDLASVLRLPGTFNMKAEPVEVVIARFELGAYTPEYLRKRLPSVSVKRSRSISGEYVNDLQSIVATLEADGRHQDVEALIALGKHHGAHNPYLTREGGLYVTRRGKPAGTSASIGYIGPGLVKVFSGAWPPLKKNAIYTADELEALAAPANVDVETGEVTPEVIDPGRFFDKTGLLHASLRTAVRDIGPIATGPGRTLWHYRSGVWLPGGDDEVRRRCRTLLGQRWRKSHAEGVVSDLAADEAFITDAQPTEWINCRNGLLDWRTGQLHPHDPLAPSTYQLAVDWNPDATCPAVDAWLDQVAPDDAIELVWEVLGTAIYPDQPFHRAVLLLGPGRNGKGTLLRLVTRLIGRRHISAVTLQALGENRFVAAELFGKVANIAGDLDARTIARTDVFKMATGGDLISAEHKYGAPFSFHNRATMLFSANEPPGSIDHTDGFFSRWVVLPFTKLRLGPGDEDHTLEARLHAELEGVLVAAVAGLRRAMDRGGYARPASVDDATLGYRQAADPLRRFVEDCVDVTGDHGDVLPRSAVYARYKEWAELNGQRPLGANRFWGRLVSIEPSIDPTRISAGTRLVGGVQLVEAWR